MKCNAGFVHQRANLAFTQQAPHSVCTLSDVRTSSTKRSLSDSTIGISDIRSSPSLHRLPSTRHVADSSSHLLKITHRPHDDQHKSCEADIGPRNTLHERTAAPSCRTGPRFDSGMQPTHGTRLRQPAPASPETTKPTKDLQNPVVGYPYSRGPHQPSDPSHQIGLNYWSESIAQSWYSSTAQSKNTGSLYGTRPCWPTSRLHPEATNCSRMFNSFTSDTMSNLRAVPSCPPQ